MEAMRGGGVQSPSIPRPFRDIGGIVLWPIALATFAFHNLIIPIRDIFAGSQGYDFVVWYNASIPFVQGRSPYTGGGAANYFVYPPSMLTLFFPFGYMPKVEARLVFLAINVAALLVGSILLLKLFELDWRSFWGAGLLLAMGLADPVITTVGFGNVNGIIFAFQAGCLVAASRSRWILAAVLFGLGLAIKPVIALVLVIFLVERKFKALAVALVIPLGLSVLAVLVNHGAAEFMSVGIPTLLGGFPNSPQTYNSSLAALAPNFHVPGLAVMALRLAAFVLTALLFYRRWRMPDVSRVLRLVELSTLALLATFLVSSVAWPAYSLYLIPFLVSVAVPNSVARHPIVWVGVYAEYTSDHWYSEHASAFANQLLASRYLLGFLLILCAFALRILAVPGGVRSGAKKVDRAVAGS